MGDSEERARRVLAAAGLPPSRLVTVRPLGGGTYNTVEELRLADGSRYVLKTAPPGPGLRYESRLLRSEEVFCQAAARTRVPAPRTVHTDPGPQARHALQTLCPGAPWDDSLTPAEQAALRRELGAQVARLHRLTGPGFGYPSGALGPLAPDWRTAFTAMLDAVLADARDYAAELPRPADEVARTLRSGYDALDEVTVARPVHFDLWPGNILVDRAPGGPRVGGLIDGERMFWGDPLADFVSLALLDDIERDRDFLAGYRDGGGRVGFGRPERTRLALYRAYLYLIMLVETVPRGVDADRRWWTRETVGPQLVAALDDLTRLRLSS
ncbi:phosphotransferase [Streptomyces sp. FBKL.4005]|uniref:phosphotransferase family protein n=1 Tax=Streptomyces sp. FBKL.4005 TaxID=2015515 RepID=UPI000B96ECC5|nr:aminoglycoside phosphotransferase family protein [Streptomyces sp. FBKL.4005]OYP13700.1 phosphotransferase [Streptomyces sp. FBKL.4005]